MAQKFISPGVFTTEVDLSFLAQGVAGIGAVVVGRTLKGPAMMPMVVTGLDSFAAIFGEPTPGYQLAYAAKNYLKNSNSLTVVRVLGHDDGTGVSNGYTVGSIQGIRDGASGNVLAVIHHSGTTGALIVSGTDTTNFTVAISGASGIAFAATASLIPSNANYIEKVLNTDPTKYDLYKHYLYQNFSYKTAAPATSASWGVVAISGSTTSFEKNFTGGSTPWIKSQLVGGVDFNLFKFHTLQHGRATNDDVKVMIANVKESVSPLATPFGTFDVVVRKFSDTDQRQVVLETFSGCTLDPNSKNFVARMIGDYVEEFDTTQRKFIARGDFQNKSRHIRVEMNTLENYPQEALPWGHRGFAKEVFTGAAATIPDMRLVENQVDRTGRVDANICWGISMLSGGVEDRMRAVPNNVVTSTATAGVDADFSLSNLSSSVSAGRTVWSYVTGSGPVTKHTPVYASASLYKFTLPLAGGFDGWDLREADPLDLDNDAQETDIGVISANRAIETIANPDSFDMNLLAVPGVHNKKVTDKARQICSDRGDALCIMDVTGSSVSDVISRLKAREIDDNYAACYYPDLKLNDRTNNKILRVSPSVAVLGAIAYSDRVGQAWFAPAGLNRGGLDQFDIVDVVDRLTFSDRNDLYDVRINPIASFPNEGIVVFGQKTLQVKASALDRINVRRLLIFAKKTIASAAKLLLFESNNASTWQRFLNTVNPILDNIRQNQGLERFKVVMDSTTNTPDLVDRNIMTGKIFLQPTKVAEFIDLSFIITNAGVSFGE